MSARSILKLSDGDDTVFLKQNDGVAMIETNTNLTLMSSSLTLIGTDGQSVNDVLGTISEFNGNFEAETAARQAADTTLTNNLAAETVARQAADTTLTNNLAAETAARQAADTTLTNLVEEESDARQTADATLTENLAAESATRAAEDVSINNAIVAEAANRAAADTTLTNNLEEEVANRQAADTTLTNNLAEETATRQEAVDALTADLAIERFRIDGILNLSAEELNSFQEIVAAYSAADSNLQTLITNLTTEFQALKAVVDEALSNP